MPFTQRRSVGVHRRRHRRRGGNSEDDNIDTESGTSSDDGGDYMDELLLVTDGNIDDDNDNGDDSYDENDNRFLMAEKGKSPLSLSLSPLGASAAASLKMSSTTTFSSFLFGFLRRFTRGRAQHKLRSMSTSQYHFTGRLSPSNKQQQQLLQQQRRRRRRQNNGYDRPRFRGNTAFQRKMMLMIPTICFQYFEIMAAAVVGVAIVAISLFIFMGWCIENGYLSSTFLLKLNSPPGRNYWQWKKYWNRPKPNRLSSEDLDLLRHAEFPAHVGSPMLDTGDGGDDNNVNNNNNYWNPEFEVIDHPGTFFLSKILMTTANDNTKINDVLQQYMSNLTMIYGIHDPDEIKQRLVTNITVPKFWDPPVFREQQWHQQQQMSGESGVRYFLGNNGKYLLAPEEAAAIGSYYVYRQDDEENTDDMATISDSSSKNNDKDNKSDRGKRLELETMFVMISSYRDPECHPTVEDLFERATFPERIRVAVIDQRVDGVDDQNDILKCGIPPEDKPCSTHPDQTSCVYERQIDRVQYNALSMVGPTFARHVAYRLYRGEYFVLQVDSHVRFVAGWDEEIIRQWKSVGNEMAVISTYMNDISRSLDPVTHASLQPRRAMMCKLQYEWPGEMEHIKFDLQQIKLPSESDTTPALHPFWAAGFSFARGHFVVQVPYDPYLPFVFQGEEILQTIRGFTYGYDYYAPIRNVAYHIYAMKNNTAKRSSVHTFKENEILFPGVKREAYKRLIAIAGTSQRPSQYFDRDESKYGLGNVRTRSQFFSVFGIHPGTKTIEDGLCKFVQGNAGGVKSMHRTFSPFLRYDKMGIDYDRVWYRHRAPGDSETYIDPKELEMLREILRRNQNSSAATDTEALDEEEKEGQ